MAGNELFFDPLQGGTEERTTTTTPVVPHPRAAQKLTPQRSLELLRVRDELEKMARAGKRA